MYSEYEGNKGTSTLLFQPFGTVDVESCPFLQFIPSILLR